MRTLEADSYAAMVHANEVVASGRLLDELWGAEPGSDTAALRVRISQLRKALRIAGCGALPPDRLGDRYKRYGRRHQSSQDSARSAGSPK